MGNLLTDTIDALIERHGGLRAAARVLEVDPAYLRRLKTGEKHNPSKRLLNRLGLQRTVTVSYSRIKGRP